MPFRVKGVTYGSFAKRRDGWPFPEPDRIEADFTAIADCGLNTVRTYAVPPPDLLESARIHDLRVLVGLDYPDWRMHADSGVRIHRRVKADGLQAVREALVACAGRPEVLAISVGNEVPSDIVRLNGRAAVEDLLSELVSAIHEGDPALLATYTSFPTAEYLRVDGQDLITFNVFLEKPEQLRPYLHHLQRLADGRPLIVTELGLAAELHGDEEQAASLAMQLNLIDEAGCAGATIFSWTDEWVTSAGPVEGWGFGLTRADRSPRPSLAVAARWSTRKLQDLRASWPAVTAVVCAYNEERHIGDCLDSLARVKYPDFEVLVCDDGSTDRTREIAERSGFTVLALPHAGLSAARNTGLARSTGEIVAYLDADAACHPEWPYHLALAFDDPHVVAAGGPNLPFPEAGLVERAVALSPGGPAEVLISDTRAEHVPGCNMAFRRAALLGIGGFNPAYTAAGDDVDVCWKLLEQGGQIAFTAAAQVRHHRRNTIAGYLRQQRSYGRAERMLQGPHRHRFNRLGAARWAGVLYGGPRILPRLLRPVVYHGPMAIAPYQIESRDRAATAGLWAATLVPLLVALGVLATPVAVVWPAVLAVPVTAVILLAAYATAVSVAVQPSPREPHRWPLRALVGLLHILQPVVRAWGRLRGRPLPPRSTGDGTWTGQRDDWLRALHRELSARWCAVRIGPPHGSWDLEVRVGPVLRCRLRTAVRWQWDPQVRRTWALGPLGVALTPAVIALPLVTPSAAIAVVGAFAIAIGVEAIALIRVSGDAIARTVRGSRETGNASAAT
jgi:GT2 family glycosyltransferase